MGLYGFAAFRMLPAMQIMYRGFAKLRFSSSALDTINRDLTLPEAPPPGTGAVLSPLREIRLDHVSYAYPSAPGKRVLDEFSLVIPAGTCVGLVGRTGAGKSTLMDIMLGLLPPQEGSMSVDGRKIDMDGVSEWQRAIGYVPQHIYLADASVAENIAFGLPRAAIDMEAVERAAKAAQIHEFVVDELADGYRTPIGERGIRLSGGQRQRIGIARALYRNPPVLFMDEATSALDAETEKSVADAIYRLSGEKTIVIIAHRQVTLERCDAVVTLDARQASRDSALR
jgi:ABC-type multidrug transport system fused ATPase/permease subunit